MTTRLSAISLRGRAVLSVFALTMLVAPGLAGCSTSSSAATGARIDVAVRDFSITMSRRSVPAGTVRLHVTNQGPSTHEINVDLTRYAPDKLPLQRDGLTVAEDAKGLRRIDSIEQVNLDGTGDLTLELKPGRYVVWCNLEGHYLGGMHQVFDVREGPRR